MADSDSENPDYSDSKDLHYKPSFVLIAIDTHPSMFITKTNEDGTVTHPFKDCLMACLEVADSLLFTTNRNSWSQFGILLAHEDSKASFVELENNLLDSIKFLKEQVEKTNEKLEQLYQRKGDLDLGAFFLLCKKKFKGVRSAFYKRTLLFVTNDDNPVGNDNTRRFTALNEAKTFEPSEISFQVVTMKDDFDYKLFYNELFSLYSEPVVSEEICEDKEGLVDKLSSAIVMRYTKQKLAFYPFKNDKERYLKVVKMNFIRSAKLYNNMKVSKDGKVLKRLKIEDTFENPELANKFKFSNEDSMGDQPLILDLKEKLRIVNNNLPRGFSLMYVSNRNTDVGFMLSPPSMLQKDPSEDLPFYDQFWQYCIANDKVLVCIKKYKSPDKLRFVELIPKYANNTKMFLIKHIPFATEINPPKTSSLRGLEIFNPTEEKIAAIKKLIDDLLFEYNPRMLSNPAYAMKKAYVKSKLLNLDMEEVEDVSLDLDEMDKRLDKTVYSINSLFGIDKNKEKKRKATTTGGRASKRK